MPKNIILTLTLEEKEEVLNALFFYQASMHLDLTGEEHARINALLDRLEPAADRQE